MSLIRKMLMSLLISGTLFAPLGSELLGAGASQEQQRPWKGYDSREGGFKVELPMTPDHIHQKIDIPKTDLSIEYDTYVSEPNESIVYVISVWHYPKEIDMSKPDVNLQDGFNGMIAALPGSKVLNMNMGDTQGFKSLDFLVKNEEIYFQGKLILVYNTLYQVFAVYKEGQEMKEDYKKFIGTFKLLNPQQHNTALPKAKNKVNI